MADFTVEQLNPRDLTPNPLNWRRHPRTQRDVLRYSLERFGFVQGAIWNSRTNRLIDGHARVEEAIEQGRETIPVNVVDLSEEDERELLRLFDPIGALAETDTEALDRLIAEIGNPDLEAMLQGIGSGGGGLLVDADPDDAPSLDEVETRAKPGQLWAMGQHRIYCGDCTKEEDVAELLGNDRLRMVWTDPPYGVSYGEKNEFLNAIAPGNRIQTPIVGDSLTEEQTERLCKEALYHACQWSIPGAAVYVACPPGTPLPHFIAAVAGSGFQFRHSLVWVKNQFVLGRCDYHYRHEIILYGWKDGAHYFVDDHTHDSVFEIDKPRRSEEHPVMKPVELVQRMIENSSRPAEYVYDPFCGSGTTLLACEVSGRVARCMEIEPRYVDVSLTRWEQATGRTAELVD